MKINRSEYIISSVAPDANFINFDFSEFAFFGRSNVGKSSFINALCGRKNLAYTSSKPGKTLTLNYYLINDSFYFVDVPGYGYAKRGIGKRLDFGKMIEKYLETQTLKIAFLLVDSKVGPTDDDVLMYNYLKEFPFKTVIISTKFDKLNQKEQGICHSRLQENLGLVNEDNVYYVSSLSNLSIDLVLNLIEENL